MIRHSHDKDVFVFVALFTDPLERVTCVKKGVKCDMWQTRIKYDMV
jgi:hypothetical protein